MRTALAPIRTLPCFASLLSIIAAHFSGHCQYNPDLDDVNAANGATISRGAVALLKRGHIAGTESCNHYFWVIAQTSIYAIDNGQVETTLLMHASRQVHGYETLNDSES